MTLFSAELPLLFSFVQVSRYLGTLEKSQKIILKISVTEASTISRGGPQGSQGAPRRVPGADKPLVAPGTLLGGSHTPWCPTFALYFPPARKFQNISPISDLRRGAAATLYSSPGELI